MSYCFNHQCQHPQNADRALTCQNCGTGLLLKGRYRAIKPLGAGGMGRTFLAIDENQADRQLCAIKQFFPSNISSQHTQKATDLFLEEIQRLKELGEHPQIPKLLDSLTNNQEHYLVQEYIPGRNLAEELMIAGPFNETKIRQLLENLLPVLQFIHSNQVIHRDIKPENIIRRFPVDNPQNALVLVDFGAAKYANPEQLAKTGTSIGSAAYTAPEQVRGKAVFASDIYSLGVTCIHLLTDIPPFDLFDTGSDQWIWRNFLRTPVSENLGKILDKMLANATNLRYHSAEEIIKDLAAPVVPVKAKTLTRSPVRLILGGLIGSCSLFYLFSLGSGMIFLWKYLFYSPTYYPSSSNPYPLTPNYSENSPASKANLPPVYGGLYFKDQAQQVQTFPLKNTEVSAKVAGNVARVEVVQTFKNPLKNPLEAIYKFPLPDESAVDDMEIRIGDRIIKGIIKERQAAKQIFEAAKKQGKTAGLLEQERDNVFTQSLANIQPGEEIEVVIRYTESLKFEGGDYEFVFPMVVGPRYEKGVANKPENNAINPPMLPAKTRSGSDINVTVEIDAGIPVSQVRSTSHQIQTKQIATNNGNLTQIQLSPSDNIPNKDLVLRYRVAGAETQSTVLTHSDNKGGHFGLYLIPAVEYKPAEIVPKDVIFLMDTSGSQSGAPLEQSKALMRRFLQGLNPKDTFTIIDFASTSTALSQSPLANTPENRQKALKYVENLEANGGSELMNGMEKVLTYPASEGRLRSIVLLTDGLMSNEDEIIAKLQKKLKPGNRLYSFGVGSSVNRFLLDRTAEVGRGISYFVRHDEPINEVTEKFFNQINSPVLTNIEVTWEGLGKPPEIYPMKAPDLFAKQPLVLFGRKQDRLSGNLKITGVAAGGKRYEKTYNLRFDEPGKNEGIAQLWGRAKIKELMMQMAGGETEQGKEAVINVSLGYRLMSKYTAFVAVSEEVRVKPDGTKFKTDVPVENPDGMVDNTDVNTAEVPEPTTIIGTLLGGGLLIKWKRKHRRKV